MIQEHNKSVDFDPAFGPAPTWQEVYAYWQSKAVPHVEVVSYEPDVHDDSIPWFEKNLAFEDRRGFFSVLSEAPKVDTARLLANTVSKGSPGLYAAFAIMTTLRDLDEWTPLKNTVCDHLDRISPDVRNYWNANARCVLPCLVEGERTFRTNRDWHLRVDLAARVWTELAARFQVVHKSLSTEF